MAFPLTICLTGLRLVLADLITLGGSCAVGWGSTFRRQLPKRSFVVLDQLLQLGI